MTIAWQRKCIPWIGWRAMARYGAIRVLFIWPIVLAQFNSCSNRTRKKSQKRRKIRMWRNFDSFSDASMAFSRCCQRTTNNVFAWVLRDKCKLSWNKKKRIEIHSVSTSTSRIPARSIFIAFIFTVLANVSVLPCKCILRYCLLIVFSPFS